MSKSKNSKQKAAKSARSKQPESAKAKKPETGAQESRLPSKEQIRGSGFSENARPGMQRPQLGTETSAGIGMEQKTVSMGEHPNKCPSCGSSNIILDNEKGEYVCNDCGLVLEENVTDNGPEWRAFDADQRNARARTGAPIKYMKPNKGLVTEIDMYNKDIRGAKLPSKRQAQLYRIRKWHKRASIASSSERNYLVALPELNRVASYLGLPDNIRESAALLYRNCVKNNLIRGRPIETVVNAALYATCRQAGMPRTLDEIAQISGVPKKEIGRTYRVVAHELGLRIPLTEPTSYVPRYVTALKLSSEAQERAVILLRQAMKKGLVSGRSPTGVSAAAVYIASALVNERRTQKEVAEVAGVTEVTIRNRYRELKKELAIDVNL